MVPRCLSHTLTFRHIVPPMVLEVARVRAIAAATCPYHNPTIPPIRGEVRRQGLRLGATLGDRRGGIPHRGRGCVVSFEADRCDDFAC